MRRKPERILPAYEDPVATFGRMAGRKESPPPEMPRTRTLWNRIFRSGHDTEFVYYDD